MSSETDGRERIQTIEEPIMTEAQLESLDLAKQIVDIAADKQASDIVLLDVRKVCSFADYFIICSGESERQLQAIAKAISDFLRERRISLLHKEGDANSGWILLDIGDVVIHIFSEFDREYYKLDELWSNAPVVIRVL